MSPNVTNIAEMRLSLTKTPESGKTAILNLSRSECRRDTVGPRSKSCILEMLIGGLLFNSSLLYGRAENGLSPVTFVLIIIIYRRSERVKGREKCECVCVCMRVCACERERERGVDVPLEPEHLPKMSERKT